MDDERISTGLAGPSEYDGVAVRLGDRRLGFTELDARSTRLARHLRDLGLRAGDPVVVQLPLCLELAETECALEKAALVKIGLAPFASVESVKDEVAHSMTRALIVHPACCRSDEMPRWPDVFDVLICIGNPMQGYLSYEDLVDTTPDARQSGMDGMDGMPPYLLAGLQRRKAVFPGARKVQVAVVGPLTCSAMMVMSPHLYAGNSLVLFDSDPGPALFAELANEGVTHVLMETKALGNWISAKTPTSGKGLAGDPAGLAGEEGDDKACAEFESALGSHPAVMEACVIKTDSHGFHAVVALHPGTHAIAAELIAYCGLCNVGHGHLRAVTFVAELPKNASGKLARKLIREQYRQAYRVPG
jgi:hypothetical protein